MPVLIPPAPDGGELEWRRRLKAVRALHVGPHWCVDPQRRRVVRADDRNPCQTLRLLIGES